MTIADLHKNDRLRESEFPCCNNQTFLAHAAVCPIPRKASEAIASYGQSCTRGDQENVFPQGKVSETRLYASQLLGCAPEEIALVGPTSIGLSLVANGLDWKAGDNVVFYPDDYPSNVVPWMALKDRGVDAREIKPAMIGQITVQDLEPLVDKRTKLVALASAHFLSGYRLDLDRIGKWVHDKGAYFCVDGIQTVGALETPVAHVDFLAADAHKWLLGPCAAGILYVSKRAQEILRPTLIGWNNISCPGYVTPSKLEWMPNARKFEAGSHNLFGVIGMNASISIILEYGLKEVENAILEHTRYLRGEITKKGYQLAAEDSERISGITSFTHSGKNLVELHAGLEKKSILTSLRQTRDGRKWIRISPHFYNTSEELERLITTI